VVLEKVDRLLPKRPKPQADMELPTVQSASTDKFPRSLPARVAEILPLAEMSAFTLSELPTSVEPRIVTEAPTRVSEKALRVLPSLTKDRTDVLDPIELEPDTDTSAPTRVLSRTLRLLPKRPIARTLSKLPSHAGGGTHTCIELYTA
jgi:hypothetical protein